MADFLACQAKQAKQVKQAKRAYQANLHHHPTVGPLARSRHARRLAALLARAVPSVKPALASLPGPQSPQARLVEAAPPQAAA